MRDKRRLIEWGKNILIVLLTLSAVVLLSMTPLVRDSGLTTLLHPRPAQTGSSADSTQSGPVLPARLAVCRDGDRFGLQYDDGRMEEVFAAFVPLLGDALSEAGTPVPLTESEWRSCLRQRGAYFDFSGQVPLAALARWLGGGSCPLEGSVRRLVLAADSGDTVSLCWEDGDGGCFTCPTALSRSLHLDPAVEAVTPNGAYFAFEDENLSTLLDPFTLITEGEPGAGLYAVTSPLSTAAGAEALVDALSFNSQNHAPGSSGEVYMDGTDRLVLRDGVTVSYRAAQGGKYPVEHTNGIVSAAQAAEGARALAEQAMAPLCGEARLYLLSVQASGNGGWRVRFGYRLNGRAVWLYEDGWAAEFLVENSSITQFTLHLRHYASQGEVALLLPIRKAAAMLPDLTQEQRELVIQYRDGGGQSVSPGWEAV